MYIYYTGILCFSSAATPFCLLIITIAPSELKPQHLVSGIEHLTNSSLIASAITSAVPEVSSKTVRKDVLYRLCMESKYHIYSINDFVTEISVDSSAIIPMAGEAWASAMIPSLMESAMHCCISSTI